MKTMWMRCIEYCLAYCDQREMKISTEMCWPAFEEGGGDLHA